MNLRTGLISASLALFQLTSAQVSLTYPSNTPPGSRYVQDNFFGISFELQVINTLIGNTPDTIPGPIHNYLQNIRNRTSYPIRLRVGGNSLDNSYYVPAQQAMIAGTIDNINYTPITYGPVLLDTMSAIADYIGGAIWDVSIGLVHVADYKNIVQFALDATQKLGSKMDSLLLGNEPDLYLAHGLRPGQANYTVQNYIDDYANILGQLHSIPQLAGSPMGGPTVCCFWDLETVLANGFLGAFKNYMKYITLQHYPQNNCVPGAQIYQLDYYLNHANTVALAQWGIGGIVMAQQAGLNVSMTEFNSVSCGGIPGISNTFGAAMWTIDYVFQLASLGLNSAYIHNREAGVAYNLFDPPVPTLDQNLPAWTTGPPYHALLVVAEALHSNTASAMAVVDLRLPSPEAAPNTIAGYALYPNPTGSASTMPPSRFVLINTATSGTATIQFNQNFTGVDATGINMTIGNVAVKYLLASSVTAAVNITWAGQVVDGGGTLQGEVANTTLASCGALAGCLIAIPGPGVAVVYMDGVEAAAVATTGTIGNMGGPTGTFSEEPAPGGTATFLLPTGSGESSLHVTPKILSYLVGVVAGTMLLLLL